ncbi:cytochrome c oxidase assembly protein subunit 15 [Pontibacter mucosus]|uniref:Cytochrome c oxidase assembly protein subunit 15 n=1 Tax=Pontibacter mucosus TaxID=1649266 RepID=A0A2T5YE01_9BACT|nr:COX15/CtaA family protein [Pontibacter mucosus]PTX14938.1 cytochrome c oxidase assembly protein subunit 15 [Pontibacter mucosus]
MQASTPNKAIIYWLLSGALLILAMVVIGGITRLTGSGLSIVEWNLIGGTLPPLSHEAWQVAFEKYKQFPEYQKLNKGMSLEGFKAIFFWEYLHRLLGRLLGVVFIVPFLYFLFSKKLTSWLFRRLLFILALGMAQGLMGWLMVKSGLVDNPHVSHFRLAAHLALALALIGLILWTVADLVTIRRQGTRRSSLYRPALLVLGLILVQIILGAFVAGLKAGFSYNTYPLMEGEFFPAHLHGHLGSLLQVLENGVAMQFAHRWTAILVLLAVGWFWYRARHTVLLPGAHTLLSVLLLVCLLQVALGIVTLVTAVPVSLGVLHQVVAVVLFSAALLLLHQLRHSVSR